MKLFKITQSTFKFDDAEFIIENLLNGRLAKIKSASTEMGVRFERDGDENIPVQQIMTDMDLEQFLIFDACCKGWKNVNSADGKELKCDPEGRKTFYDNLPNNIWSDFYKALSEERKKLSGVEKDQSEKAVKNS